MRHGSEEAQGRFLLLFLVSPHAGPVGILLLLQVMIDHEQKQLRLIDWGLAEFYHPGKEYAAVPDFSSCTKCCIAGICTCVEQLY